jgi:hypothetical protein
MKSGNRWPSCRLSARIAKLSQAGKYAEAIPRAQGQLESLEKNTVPSTAMSRAR